MHVIDLISHLFLLFIFMQLSFQLPSDLDSLSSYCIDGKNHKRKPGPEDQLHSQCTPWKENACCTDNTTILAHGSMYGFNYDHCPGKRMSDKCREHFIQDLCFYECSPNVGPWRQSVEGMKIRKERYFQVPLCASDCESWFNACRNDYTCTDNWTRNFKWVGGANQCPTESRCHTFAEVYGNASHFCQQVWDDSWKYTPDSEHCMRIWFDGSAGNPNDAVTRWKIQQQANRAGNSIHHVCTSPFGIYSLTFIIFLLIDF